MLRHGSERPRPQSEQGNAMHVGLFLFFFYLVLFFFSVFSHDFGPLVVADWTNETGYGVEHLKLVLARVLTG